MDKNLKFAILDNLITNGDFYFDREEFFQNNPEIDSADYEYSACKLLEDYFENIALESSKLQSLDEFSWGISAEIISSIWKHYDGEDDYFDISSLEGLENCPNITEIFFEYCWNVRDLSPLNKLKKLQEITIYSNEIEVNSLEPLAKLPNLKKIQFEGLKFKDQAETDKIVEILKSKGVEVDIS